jgi:hypothetical protein
MAGFMERSEIQAGMLAEREAAVVAQSEFAGTAAGGLVEAEGIAASGAARAGVAEGTMNIPEGLMEEAGRLEGQWPAQMQALRESEVPLNMASEAGGGVAAEGTAAPEGPAGSGLNVVPRRGMSMRLENGVPIYGQAESSSTTLGHSQAIIDHVNVLAQSGEYEYITLQRAWRTATGRVGSSSLRPDVIGVRKNGIVDAWEVQSDTDIYSDLLQRLREGRSSLPPERQGTIGVIQPTP